MAKGELQVAWVGLVGLLLAGGIGWLVVELGAEEERVERARVDAPVSEGADGRAEAATEERVAARQSGERTDAAPETSWIVRGVVTLGRREALPHAPLVLSLREGGSTAGALLAEGRARSGADGAFAWAAPAPEGAATLVVGIEDDDASLRFERAIAPGAGAPQDLLLAVYPLDVALVGRVLDPDGAPVAGARVRTFMASATTDDAGRFRLRASSESSILQCRAVAPGFELARFELSRRSAGEWPVDDVVLRRAVVLRGRVVDGTGAPIAGAEIDTMYGWRPPAVSDEEGRFLVDWLAPGSRSAWLRASAPGFCRQRRELSADDFERGELEWTLVPGSSVSGTVRDERGAPVPGARVAAGDWLAEPVAEVWTGPDGRFELPPLAPGETRAWALREGLRSASFELTVPRDGSEPPPIEFVLRRGGFLAGRVVDERGEPVPFVHVYFDDRGGEWHVPRHDTDALGRFRVEDLPPAPVVLGFLREGHLRHEERFETLDAEGLVVRLERAGAIAGRVVDGATGAPVESFRVRFVPPAAQPGDRGLMGYWAGWASDGPGVPFAGTGGAWSTEGSEELTIGAVTGVEVLAEGYAPAIVERVVVAAEADPDQLVIQLLAAAQAVLGEVVALETGEPVAGARVRAFRDRAGPSTDHDGAVLTDAAGRFQLEGLSVGEASLVVDRPGFARAFDGPILLRPGERAFRSVALDAGARIRGSLLDPAGTPRAGERIDLVLEEVDDPARPIRETETDEDGTFHFDALRPGEYQVSWLRELESGETWYEQSRLVVVEPRETEVLVDLSPRGRATIVGTLAGLDSAADPVTILLMPVMDSVASAEARAERIARVRCAFAREGRFSIEHVEAGLYRVAAEHRGRLTRSIELRVPETGEVSLVLPMASEAR